MPQHGLKQAFPLKGTVSSANSLVGTKAGDMVGETVPLANGNYVVGSSSWNNGVGAATWADGAKGLAGAVSSSNSLVGSVNKFVGAADGVAFRVVALSNGNYLVVSPGWNSGLGAVTWGNGLIGVHGVVSSSNSLIGAVAGDELGHYGALAFSEGNYAVDTPTWNEDRGAVTLANGAFRQTGVIPTSMTATGSIKSYTGLPFTYDPARHQLIVGRPMDNVVTLITMDEIFAAGFD